MKILFASSSPISLDVFYSLLRENYIVGVLTNNDKSLNGRISKAPNIIKSEALKHNLKVFSPNSLNDSNLIGEIKKLEADLMVVFSYGKIFKEEFLNIFPKGAVNIHPSLLPKYRGPAPIQYAILNGESESGITVQKMALKMDSGNILLAKPFKIRENDTSATIIEYVKRESPALLLEALSLLNKGFEGIKQREDEASFSYLLKKENSFLNFNESAEIVKNKIHAYNPWPLARAFLEEDLFLFYEAKVYEDFEPYINEPSGKVLAFDSQKGILIKTGEGILGVLNLQKSAKKKLDFRSFYNGNKDIIGKIFKSSF